METLQISPSILRWAADQRGLSVDALVDLLGKPTRPEKRAALRRTIPDAAKQFGIQSLIIYDLLSQHAKSQFALHR